MLSILSKFFTLSDKAQAQLKDPTKLVPKAVKAFQLAFYRDLTTSDKECRAIIDDLEI